MIFNMKVSNVLNFAQQQFQSKRKSKKHKSEEFTTRTFCGEKKTPTLLI